MAEQVESTFQFNIQPRPICIRKGGEKDAVVPDQFGIVVVHHQHRVQRPWQWSHLLLTQHNISVRSC